jgi:antitoxin (DNA-binding transcriptional repressor) of toxin-antitoxin stability system
MTVVNISELKNRLSHYLRQVQKGKIVLVKDRDRVVARIEAVREVGVDDDEERRLADLERRGVLRRPTKMIDRAWVKDFLASAPVVDADVVGALLREREEGP